MIDFRGEMATCEPNIHLAREPDPRRLPDALDMSFALMNSMRNFVPR